MMMEDPAPHRRMELGVAVDRQLVTDSMLNDLASYISAQSNLPWHSYTWLGHRHTVQCEPSPVGGVGEKFAAMLLVKDPPGAPAVAMPAYRGDPVNLLWMTPITAAEWNFAREQRAGELLEKLIERGFAWPHRQRMSVI